MSKTLVDANVLLDIFTEDEHWMEWSSQQLAVCANSGELVINPIIYAEVSSRFTHIEELETALPSSVFGREQIPWPAAFLAEKCFLDYRRSGGTRNAPLPDFFIGAHAAVSDYTLLSRDKGRYSHYFPQLRLISP